MGHVFHKRCQSSLHTSTTIKYSNKKKGALVLSWLRNHTLGSFQIIWRELVKRDYQLLIAKVAFSSVASRFSLRLKLSELISFFMTT